MKIAICTNLPVDYNPMMDAYLSYMKNSVSSITISSVSCKRILTDKNILHYQTNYLRYKIHYLIIPCTILYILFQFIYFFISKRHLRRKFIHYSLKDYISDFFSSLKFYTNQLYLNIFHFFVLIISRPEVVISICAASTISARWYCRITGRKYIYSMYEIYPNQPEDVMVFRRYIKADIEKNGCIHAALIITFLGKNYERLLKMRYHLPSDKKYLQLAYITKEPEAQSTLNIVYPVKLYYHGIFDAHRGLDVLIRSMKNIDHEKAHLYLRGFGYYESELKRIVTSEKLESKISFLPPVPPEEIYNAGMAYDVGITVGAFSCPNYRFLIGFKIIDYITNGLAVIAPAGYILKNLVEENDTGAVYNQLNETAITKTIEKFIGDLARLKVMKQNVRALHEKKINIDTQKNNFLKSLKECA